MTLEEIRAGFDWTPTKADMRDRVIRAIFEQQALIAACTGALDRAQSITWCDYSGEFPLSAGNFRFDAGGWACEDESILATRRGENE